jgi:hypothetical protein
METSSVEFVSHLRFVKVRAANLAHCRDPLERLLGGGHESCVARRAAHSVATIKQIPPDEAQHAVQQIFTRCLLLSAVTPHCIPCKDNTDADFTCV